MTFDKNLDPFNGMPLGWLMKAENTDWAFLGGVVTNTTMTVEMDQQGPGDPGQIVSYFGTDPRLKGTDGQLVEAFSDFPLTVI